MYKLYRINNKKSESSYVGITKNSLSRRFSDHKLRARNGYKTKLYDAMRSYGVDNFEIRLLKEFVTRQECMQAEIDLIAKEDSLYNLASGGDGGFSVVDVEDWKQKLRIARKGRQPFLGHKHSNETKAKCAEASRKRWANKRAEINDLG